VAEESLLVCTETNGVRASDRRSAMCHLLLLVRVCVVGRFVDSQMSDNGQRRGGASRPELRGSPLDVAPEVE